MADKVYADELLYDASGTPQYDNTVWPLTMEQRDPDVDTAERIAAAERFFAAHFDDSGAPTTQRGILLHQKYKTITTFNLRKIMGRTRWTTVR